MKPLFQPVMVNGPFADPVLYLDFLFERRALLFDAGDLRALPTRKLLRVSDVFVSHTHMDHFADFDWLLRLCLGRDRRLRLFGPPGFIDRVAHKLGAYTWNLVHNYDADLTLTVTEMHPHEHGRQARFRVRSGFAREDEHWLALPDNRLVAEPALEVHGAVLDHGTPCIGYAVTETRHVNIWKNRLAAMGLPAGPWLKDLKQAVLDGRPAGSPIRAWWREGGLIHERHLTLGELQARAVRITPGQKVGYVVDAAGHADNARRIIGLVRGASVLFIEAGFLDEDAGQAARKCHLTARQAGALARQAGVQRLEPVHFSPRYADREQALRDEAQAAFAGDQNGRSSNT
ncbi:MAG: MBL fold metallo-hydrolase [Pseudomonadota bacterium]|nr:MBL fold metallo-hydrolase [Pseudomonadota bacterium]